MSEPQPEIVQMHRRYCYAHQWEELSDDWKVAIENGELPRILCIDGPSETHPVVSIDKYLDTVFHDQNGYADLEDDGLCDLLPLPESDQPPAPREWTLGMASNGAVFLLNEMNKPMCMDKIRVREVTG